MEKPLELVEIMMEARDIADKLQVTIKHLFREGNLLADSLIANSFIEGNRSNYNQFN